MKKNDKKVFTYFYEQNFKVEKLNFQKNNSNFQNGQDKSKQTKNQIKR